MSSRSGRRSGLRQRNFRLGLLSKCSFVVLSIVGGGGGDALGQTPTAGNSTSRTAASGGETIVVTAQRRSEAISKVPVAVTALTSAALSRHTVTKETDLQSIVPGLTVKTTGSQNQLNYAIRGQTLDAFSGSSPGVLTYVNDVQVSSQTATALYDLGNVQVLKGPQGTLFGRNATGGAVLYGTAMPSDEYHGFLTLRGGDYDMRQFTGAVDLPILPGQFTVRLAGDLDQQNGYVKNLHDNTTLGDTDAKSVRLTAKWTPNADITDVTVVQYGNYGGTNLVGELQSVNPVGSTYQGTPLNATGAAIYGPAIFAALGKQDAQGPYTTNIPFTSPPFQSKTIYVANTFSYTFSPDLEFKNIASYSRSDTYTSEILSGSPYGVIDLVQPDGAPTFFGIHQWSEEAQLLGHAFDNKLKYIVGVYAASEEDIDQVPVTVGFGLPTPVEAFNYNYNNRDSTQAVYGQATYDLSDLTTVNGLSITGGIRYTFEELSLFQTGGSLYQGMPKQSMSESKPSWQAGLQWQLNPQLLLYFVNRGSWRSGNFNGTTTPVDNQNAFNAETTYDRSRLARNTTGKFSARAPAWRWPSMTRPSTMSSATSTSISTANRPPLPTMCPRPRSGASSSTATSGCSTG